MTGIGFGRLFFAYGISELLWNATQGKNDMYKRYIKRLFDLLLSACGLIVLSPLFLVLILLVIAEDPGSIFFYQKRIGKNRDGRISYFKMYKFRSMKEDAPRDVPTHLLMNPEQYITRVGRILRRTSLDELPQIINILKGDMAIIGPRPALWNQEDLYKEREKYGANDVLPGLTGWAQINGRDELEIPEKARLDGEYVEKMNLFFDMKCFFGSILSVLRCDGFVEGGTGKQNKQ